jgi:ABC-type amino acid transport substrate-binding protein
MKKRVLAILLTGAMSLGLLAGCGSTETSGDAAGSTSEDSTEDSTADSTEASSDSSDEVQTIKVGIISTIPKSSFIDDDGNLAGYEVSVIQAIDELLPQYEIEFVQLEGTAMFASLDAGKVDFVSGNYRRSDAREENHIHTYRSYFYTPYTLMNLAENGEFNTLADYEGKTIGTGDGSLMADIIEQYIAENNANINLVYVTDYAGELSAGRVDGIAVPRVSILNYQEAYPDMNFHVADTWMNGTDECMKDANAYYFMRPEDTELRDALSEAIYQLREDGTLKELCEQWYGEDYVSDIDVDCEKELIDAYGITDYKE